MHVQILQFQGNEQMLQSMKCCLNPEKSSKIKMHCQEIRLLK